MADKKKSTPKQLAKGPKNLSKLPKGLREYWKKKQGK